MALVYWFKLARRPVAWWGHGYTKTEQVTGPARVVHRLAATVKSAIANLADAYLVYSDDGKQRLINADMPETKITVVPNTLDLEPHIKAARDIADIPEPELRRQVGLSHAGPVLLFCGRLYPEKQPERLLHAVQTINASRTTPVHAVVIGDGPMRSALESRYQHDPAVHIVGPIYDTPQLARWFRVASAVVLPGKVGLGICHSFAHATPVVTCDTPFHAPEIAYLEHEVNGLLVADNDAALVAGLARLLDEPGLLERLARGAEATCGRLSQAAMTAAFHRGVVGMLAARGRWRDTETLRPAPPKVV